ncbi:MAG: type II toxin-antitoxin system RelE/ParE family toxin [Ferruginibacter sp.]
MSFSVIPSGKFKKEAKRLIKKFPSLKQELVDLNFTLENEPGAGTPLGSNVFKIRIAIKSKGKGKSGGGRIITYVLKENKEVYLLTIYDKSEFDSIDDKLIRAIIKAVELKK